MAEAENSANDVEDVEPAPELPRKVHIKTPGPFGRGAEITTADGAKIHSVRAVDIKVRPSVLTLATIEVYSGFEGESITNWVIRHPLTSEIRRIRRVEFWDGGAFEVFDFTKHVKEDFDNEEAKP